jgi:hypothetical protein
LVFVDAVEAVAVGVVIVDAALIVYPEENEEAAGHPQGQAEDV